MEFLPHYKFRHWARLQCLSWLGQAARTWFADPAGCHEARPDSHLQDVRRLDATVGQLDKRDGLRA